ncbi:hypothetical protein [Treponema phagedenis]|uniref:hypothetical protein n=1 Tax=Treponema phagedenis TaxID=162 RepID=UPI0015A0BB14|nr:hypothetical protein [Treponema phagedenis]NVP24315.1 hypothetical protein [Treponema phagedenis]QLC59822.1 hypothetical protein HW453_14200 [Treponema phagedenis]
MNRFYKVFNLGLFIYNLFIIGGIALAVSALNVDFMMYYLALNGDRAFFQWIIIFILFLIEFLFYLKNSINRKNVIFSIIVILIHYYLTYLCMFTHTPDVFTFSDVIFFTKRFFLHMPLMYYWFILQGLSYIIGAVVKNKKQLRGFRINTLFSVYRVIFLWLSLLPLLLFDETNAIHLKEFIIGFILVPLVYFIISFMIELSMDFILRQDLVKSEC